MIGVPDERWDEKVVAAVQPKPGARIDPDALREFCADYIARHKLPKEIVFVEEFPRTGLGKISKHVLKAQLAADGGLET